MNLAAQIAQRSITIEANANAEGHLYGSVNADQIAAALRADNFPIEPENVKIEGPLKELGLYTIKLHLGQDVDTEVKLWVVPTHTEEAADLSPTALVHGRSPTRSWPGTASAIFCDGRAAGSADTIVQMDGPTLPIRSFAADRSDAGRGRAAPTIPRAAARSAVVPRSLATHGVSPDHGRSVQSMATATEVATAAPEGRVSGLLADRLPPQNLEAEQGVLGSILLDNDVLHEVVPLLQGRGLLPRHATRSSTGRSATSTTWARRSTRSRWPTS